VDDGPGITPSGNLHRLSTGLEATRLLGCRRTPSASSIVSAGSRWKHWYWRGQEAQAPCRNIRTIGEIWGSELEDEFVVPQQGPRETGLVTPRGVVSRDSESFAQSFRAASGTLKVPLDPRTLSPESERAVPEKDEGKSLRK
jgi:hypothetical protein